MGSLAGRRKVFRGSTPAQVRIRRGGCEAHAVNPNVRFLEQKLRAAITINVTEIFRGIAAARENKRNEGKEWKKGRQGSRGMLGSTIFSSCERGGGKGSGIALLTFHLPRHRFETM